MRGTAWNAASTASMSRVKHARALNDGCDGARMPFSTSTDGAGVRQPRLGGSGTNIDVRAAYSG